MVGTKQAAQMLGVTPRTIVNWAERELIPYVRLPGGQYRIPLAGLAASLGGTYDVAAELAAFDAANENVSEDEILRQVLEGEPSGYRDASEDNEGLERGDEGT